MTDTETRQRRYLRKKQVRLRYGYESDRSIERAVGDKIIDGITRALVCYRLGIEPKYNVIPAGAFSKPGSLEAYIASQNIHRREGATGITDAPSRNKFVCRRVWQKKTHRRPREKNPPARSGDRAEAPAPRGFLRPQASPESDVAVVQRSPSF
jgi:hypothetical protein